MLNKNNNTQTDGYLLKGETTLKSIRNDKGSTFILTNLRIIFYGGSSSKDIFGYVSLEDLTSFSIKYCKRPINNLIWSILGIIALLGSLQVIENQTGVLIVSVVLSSAVIILLAGYFFVPRPISMEFRYSGGLLSCNIKKSNITSVNKFLMDVTERKRQLQNSDTDHESDKLTAYKW